MTIRKFWLENAAGELRPLNGEHGIFLENPYGLGLESGAAYASAGGGFFVLSRDASDKQIPMGGDLLFLRRPYALFTDFADWVLRSERLTFVYQPGTVAYRRRVDLSGLTKTEKNTPVSLAVPVKFLPLTPWYTEVRERFTLGITGDGFRVSDDSAEASGERDDGEFDPDDGDGSDAPNEDPLDVSEEPLILDGGTGLEAETGDREDEETRAGASRVWDESTDAAACAWMRVTESEVLSGSAAVAPIGQVDSTFDLSFVGSASRPTICVIGAETGMEYGRCAVNATLADGETLLYSTSPVDAYIRKRSASGAVVDLLDAVDLSFHPFPRLPTSEACRVLLMSDSHLRGTLTVSVQRYLREV